MWYRATRIGMNAQKTITAFAASVVFSLIGATGAWAQGFDEVMRTTHNVFSTGASTPMGEVCGSCHFDGEPSGRTPAWDRNTAVKVFLPTGLTADVSRGRNGARPFGPSIDCLGCHDGVLGSDVHQIGLSSEGAPRISENSLFHKESRSPDHPDSILYPVKPTGELMVESPDPALQRYWSIPDRTEDGITLPTTSTSDYLNIHNIDTTDPAQTSNLVRTFMGVVHCDTCHNPHVNESRPFLRLPPQQLCLACHQR